MDDDAIDELMQDAQDFDEADSAKYESIETKYFVKSQIAVENCPTVSRDYFKLAKAPGKRVFFEMAEK